MRETQHDPNRNKHLNDPSFCIGPHHKKQAGSALFIPTDNKIYKIYTLTDINIRVVILTSDST